MDNLVVKSEYSFEVLLDLGHQGLNLLRIGGLRRISQSAQLYLAFAGVFKPGAGRIDITRRPRRPLLRDNRHREDQSDSYQSEPFGRCGRGLESHRNLLRMVLIKPPV